MQDLTTGPVSRHLLKTSSFMLVTMMFQTAYFLVDLYWVGHLGKEAVAAVGIAGNLMFVVLALSQMLGVGTTTLVSHAAGQKDHARAELVFNQSQVLSMLAGLGTLIVGMATTDFYTESVSAKDGVTAALAADYLRWFLPAMALQFAMVAMGSAMRGTGNFKPSMVVSSITVIINMIIAPFLMFGWGTGRPMGVAGAALATFIAVVIGIIWLSTYFFAADSFLKFRPREWAPRFDLWRKMIGIGLPTGAEFALMAVYLGAVYTIIRPFGAAAQAGFGIGIRVVQAGFMPVVALGFAVAPVAGQNYGAKLGRRVRDTYRTAGIMAVSVMFVFALLCHIAPATLIGLFVKDQAVIDVGTEYLRIVSWNYLASGLIYVNSSMFQAMGNTIPSLVTSASRMVVVLVPAILLSRRADFQLNWVWYLSVASVIVQLAFSLLLLRREFKRKLDPLPA
jgi:putative MATE family efflux protein